MYIAILGRQPSIGIAELERVFGDVTWFNDHAAVINTDSFDIEKIGGTLKAGRVVAEVSGGDWRKASIKLVQAYTQAWAGNEGKITLGLSAYGFTVSPRDVQKTGIILKTKLKQSGVSLRLVPNTEPALNTATSHHNKLGLSNNKVELLIVRGRNGKIIIAESTGAQNITSLAKRDQERPKRDAFVGMLPPKLAQIMINLASPSVQKANSGIGVRGTKSEEQPKNDMTESVSGLARNGSSDSSDAASKTILDPFCGTGVLLQEAMLMGYNVYGTDLSEKMVRYSRDNINWLQDTFHVKSDWYVHEGDAMTTKWRPPISAIACEAYLGQPFSAPPSPSKLIEVRGNCDHIISDFLINLAPQLTSGTPLCVAVPAWKSTDGSFTHLPLIKKLDQLGYSEIQFKNVRSEELLYHREEQVVARELLVLVKS